MSKKELQIKILELEKEIIRLNNVVEKCRFNCDKYYFPPNPSFPNDKYYVGDVFPPVYEFTCNTF